MHETWYKTNELLELTLGTFLIHHNNGMGVFISFTGTRPACENLRTKDYLHLFILTLTLTLPSHPYGRAQFESPLPLRRGLYLNTCPKKSSVLVIIASKDQNNANFAEMFSLLQPKDT